MNKRAYLEGYLNKEAGPIGTVARRVAAPVAHYGHETGAASMAANTPIGAHVGPLHANTAYDLAAAMKGAYPALRTAASVKNATVPALWTAVAGLEAGNYLGQKGMDNIPAMNTAYKNMQQSAPAKLVQRGLGEQAIADNLDSTMATVDAPVHRAKARRATVDAQRRAGTYNAPNIPPRVPGRDVNISPQAANILTGYRKTPQAQSMKPKPKLPVPPAYRR